VRYQRLFDLSEGGGAVRFSAELLYPNGTVRREERWRDGLPEAASDFDATGRVVRECDYVAGQPGDCRLNRWKNGRLVSTETRSAAGELLQTVSFGYTVRGRIHQTERRWPDGRLERFVYRYGEDGLNGNWSEDAEQGQSWLYDDSGRLLRQEDWVAGEVVRRVTLTWADVQGTRLASRVSEEPKTRFRMEEAFDEQGRVVQHDEWLKDELQARVSQEWDADGNLVLRNTVGPRGSESWSAEYRDKLAVVERYAKNGLPVKVLTRDGDDSIEEIYLNGVLRLRAWYHGSDKYQEEDIRDGQVYRTRTFKNR
jgi:antitoxin component YwqK of YwqJK toxin-antitoxin module